MEVDSHQKQWRETREPRERGALEYSWVAPGVAASRDNSRLDRNSPLRPLLLLLTALAPAPAPTPCLTPPLERPEAEAEAEVIGADDRLSDKVAWDTLDDAVAAACLGETPTPAPAPEPAEAGADDDNK